MKTNLRRFSLLNRMYDLSVFYVIRVTKGGISLQGDFLPEIVRKADELKFSSSINENGYLVLKRGVYKIVLT